MIISEKFKNKRPIISFEIYPPKREEALRDIDETLKILCELKPDYISVTFGAGGSSNNNKTIALAKKIKDDYGVEPLVHLTCLTYNKNEIDQFLRELQSQGLENILALRGDRNHNIAQKEDFFHASELTTYIKKNGNFCVAGACYPEGHPESPDMVSDITNIKKKVEAGDAFLISQLFFENEMFYNYVEKLRIAGVNVPVTAGIMPVINKAQIEKMVSVCGASLPEKFKRILTKFENNKEALYDAGIAYAVNQVVDLLASDVDGIHLYTMNNPRVARKICESIRNII
ncbi:MAG: methylenetetrahydrofolate reductase [NAD(P)H] [Lachnospiraceae bacterium]|jgi:5,10-methylenetetrahydrofolate reductase, prokaryotic form|nr:methylenetetrahydrofolate reductase [NAD(P)H] [Lachnospiraceae bacterium]